MPKPVPSMGQPSDNRNTAILVARAVSEKQAEHIVILDLHGLSTIADYFVIATVLSARQMDAVAKHVESILPQLGSSLWHTEASEASYGAGKAQGPLWTLLDCGNVVVHLFDPQAREFYRLEDLWADAPRISTDPTPPPAPKLLAS